MLQETAKFSWGSDSWRKQGPSAPQGEYFRYLVRRGSGYRPIRSSRERWRPNL